MAAQLTRPGLTPFAQVRLRDGAAVGCTAYWNTRTWPESDDPFAVEIGWTWLAASAQQTGINAEAKLLLLTHAFETLRLARVDLKTDARNQRSRQAIERLGARFEGVLRSWSPSHVPGEEGKMRDSAMFSLIAAEWPDVKAHLAGRVARRAPAGGTGLTQTTEHERAGRSSCRAQPGRTGGQRPPVADRGQRPGRLGQDHARARACPGGRLPRGLPGRDQGGDGSRHARVHPGAR